MDLSAKKRTLYLDVARVAAIVSISLNHAVNRTFQNYQGQQEEFLAIPLASSVVKVLFTIFSKLGVPLFLMISGALLLNKRMDGPEDVKKFYKHDLLPLLIAAQIWYAIMYWCRLIAGVGDLSLSQIGLGPALLGMVKTMLFLDQNTFDSMWYMPMILGLYTTLPFLVIAKDKLGGSRWLLWVPGAAVFLFAMVIPAVNGLIRLLGGTGMALAVREADLISLHYVYVLAGYFLSQGALEKLKDRTVALLALITFAGICGYQLFAYAQPLDYLVDYNFPLLPVCAAFLFEWIRRKSHRLQRFQRPICYIARISLGIYFVHILVMTGMSWVLGDWGRTTLWRLLVLEAGSVGLSVAAIALMSRSRLARKYLFLIK